MHLLFISNYFPPEVNAPATRLIEHARQWVKDGHSVEVLTSVPNYPEGKLHEGYRNRFQQETVEGILVTRVPMYIAENKGLVLRTLSYVSFMLTAILYCGRIHQKPDVIVATSPQLFGAIGGYLIAKFKQVPFVMEVRDLWPESIMAVGAMKPSLPLQFFQKVADFMYRTSHRIIVVTESFKPAIVERGADPDKITILKNGADLEFYSQPLDERLLENLKAEYQIQGKFVVSYIGTIGMAHRVDVMLEAAQRCQNPDIVFLVVGAGAERATLERRQKELQLSNFRLVERQPKERIPYLLALTDASLVHLRDTPTFRKVIPSKMFEAMVMRTPVILGVAGEAQSILETAQAGISIPSENPEALMEAVLKLYENKELYQNMASSGYNFVRTNYDRQKIARQYWAFLESIVDP